MEEVWALFLLGYSTESGDTLRRSEEENNDKDGSDEDGNDDVDADGTLVRMMMGMVMWQW